MSLLKDAKDFYESYWRETIPRFCFRKGDMNMRIAFILDAFPTLSETFILNQITGLLDLGHEVDVFADFNPNQEKVHPDVKKYDLLPRTYYPQMPANKLWRVVKAIRLLVINLPQNPITILKSLNVLRYGKGALSLGVFYHLLPFLDNSPYDIIHCHLGPSGKIGVFLSELGVKGKVITSFYGYDVSAHVAQIGRAVYDTLFQQGALFIAICDHIKKRLIDLGCDKDRIVKHPLGIDVERFPFREKRRRAGEKIKILTVARLVQKKGLEYSIKAVAKVVKKHPDVEYNIAGDGPLRSHLGSLISELGTKEQVKLLGWQDQDEIRRLYQESHIFVLASVTAKNGDQEGTPTVLMEAQAQGLPIVSTLHAGIPEITLNDKSGFLVPERDVNALVQRLEYLIEHPELWPSMGRAGRKFVEERYDIRRLNRRLVEIYEALVKGRDLETPVVPKAMG